MSCEFAEYHRFFMEEALRQAKLAMAEGEVPVGCVVVYRGEMIVKEHNRREADHDPTAHAEVLAIRKAAAFLKSRRLHECSLYVTLEPCPMCAGAIMMAEMKECFFGAEDPSQGCLESVYAITRDPSFYRQVSAYGGLMRQECLALLQSFFQTKR